MKKLFYIILIFFFVYLAFPDKSWSIPAFARKYGFNCNMCHTAYTKLNDFGQRFRDNGYQIPGQEGKEKNVFQTSPPISLRTTTGFSMYNSDHGTTAGFNIFGFDFLAAGVLHKNISFLLIYTPRIDEPAADYQGPGNGDNPVQFATLESVGLVFSNIIQDALNLRIGRFEPAYHMFSSKRSYYLFQPYEIYTFTTPADNYVFDDNQIGIEATGHFRNGFKYGAGFINGNGANPDNNKYKDIYATISQTFGRGEGQSAGQRLGVFGYYGWQPLDLPGGVIAPTGETDGTDNKSFTRFGGSASLNWKTFNLQGLFMKGIDDKVFNSLEPTKKYEYTGGFVELDYAGLLDNRLVLSGLFNWVTPPSYNSNNQINAFSALIRYYLGDWTAVNVAIHAEYTHRQIGKSNTFKDDIFALLLDFDF